MTEEIKASGIEVDPPSEFESAMEELCEKFDASERDLQTVSDEKRAKLEQQRRQAEDIRSKALETMGETKKRKIEEDNQEKRGRSRRSGGDTIAYLKEKSQQDMVIRQQELQMKREAQAAQEKHQGEMMKQLLKQQEMHQSDLGTFQQQQQQQLQQMSQMQLALMQQQQQQSQALLAVMQELAKNK